MTSKELSDRIAQFLAALNLDPNAQKPACESLQNLINDYISQESLRSKLQLLFDYEKHYLDMLKEYKEEIKFANTIHEELRRERSAFFTQTLKDVALTLRDAQVDSSIASKWIEELVASYTRSLDLGADLARNETIDMIAKLRKEARTTVKKCDDGE